ncbi:hypothetical protein BGX24_002677 [Mortierella sp. AD032]|nr:hypothetical protein BGX24_002677 [Mortierella sp. AD032]
MFEARANVISNLSRPADQRPVLTNPVPKPTTTTSVNKQPDQGWRQNTTSYSTDSSASPTTSTGVLVGISEGNPSTDAPAEVSTFDADISFGGDEFFLEGDELALADLMDDLDQVKRNGDNEDISLSWSPTPPKVTKASTLTPLSPPSPLSRFSTTTRNTGTMSTISSTTTSTFAFKQPSASNSYAASSSTLSASSTAIRIQDKPSSSFRASATAAAATSTSSFTKSFPRGHVESNNSPQIITISSQEPTTMRPNERDTMGNRDWQASSKPTSSVGHIREQESRGLSRSKSSPNAASGSIPFNGNKRTLPGPAGNLPRLSEDERNVLLRSRGVPFNKDTRLSGITNTSPNSSIKKKMRSINQGLTDSMFETKPWKDMLAERKLGDYKPSTLDSMKGTSPLTQVTISDIESRQNRHRGKILWLVVIIKDFTPSEIDAAVTLMDPSGEMKGTVHNSVLEYYKNNEIRIGTVLVLNNVSPEPVLTRVN